MSDDPAKPTELPPGGPAGKNLYSIQGILLATFLGSLAAGIILIYLNYVGLGYHRLAKLTITWGMAGFILIMLAISLIVPNGLTFAVVFMVLQLALAGFSANRLQGAAIAYHRAHQGKMHSPLRAAGFGVLTGMAFLVLQNLLGLVPVVQ